MKLKLLCFFALLTISSFSQNRVAKNDLVFSTESKKLMQAIGWFRHSDKSWYKHENYIGGLDAKNLCGLCLDNFTSIHFKKASINKERFYVLVVERKAFRMEKKQGIEAINADYKYNYLDTNYIDYYFFKKSEYMKIQEFTATPIQISFFVRILDTDDKEDATSKICKGYNQKKRSMLLMLTKQTNNKVQFLLPFPEQEKSKFGFSNCYYETSIKNFLTLFQFQKNKDNNDK